MRVFCARLGFLPRTEAFRFPLSYARSSSTWSRANAATIRRAHPRCVVLAEDRRSRPASCPAGKISTSVPAFVDTNVLVYAEDGTAGRRHDLARDLIITLWNDRCGWIAGTQADLVLGRSRGAGSSRRWLRSAVLGGFERGSEVRFAARGQSVCPGRAMTICAASDHPVVTYQPSFDDSCCCKMPAIR